MTTHFIWTTNSTGNSLFLQFLNSINSGSDTVSGRYSFIGCGGGYDPTVPTSFGSTVSGNYSSVVGGRCNMVSGNYSAILGGAYNTIAAGATYSSILGGYGNTITAGYSNSFIAGSGITVGALAGQGVPNALHVNGLWANGFPMWTSGPTPKQDTIFVVPVSTTPPTGIQGQLFIA